MASKDEEVRAVTAELEALLPELMATVTALSALADGVATGPAADEVKGGAAP